MSTHKQGWLAAAISTALLLSGCGGGGGSPSATTAAAPTAQTPTPTAQASATVTTGATPAWSIATPLSIVLKDASGNVIPAAQVLCSAANPTNLTVQSNCSSVIGHRLGVHNIVVRGGGAIVNAAVTVVPQQQALGSQGVGNGLGGTYSFVVTPNQQILAWGMNGGATLGQGLTASQLASSSLPVFVLNPNGTAPLSGIVAASAGNDAALALTSGGEVYSWGFNNNNQLGRNAVLNSLNESVLPGLVSNPANNGVLQHIVQISMGNGNAAALSDDGTVYSWGAFIGQNLPSPDNAAYPGQVVTASGSVLSNVVQIAAGSGFTLALTASGQVYAWGFAQAGNGGPIPSPQNAGGLDQYYATPITLASNGKPLSNIVAISTGVFVSYALDSTGHVWAWGSNTEGELGQNNQTAYTGAVEVLNQTGNGFLSNIKMVAAGGNSALALDNNGDVWSWGFDMNGQLGDGPNNPRGNQGILPAAVIGVNGTGQLSNVSSLAMNYDNCVALTSTGSVLMWGAGFGEALGQGGTSTADLYLPAAVKDVAGTGNLVLSPLSVYQNLLKRGIP